MLVTSDKLRHRKMCSLVIRKNSTSTEGTMLGTADKLRHWKMCSLVIRHGTGADGHHAWDNGQAPSHEVLLFGDTKAVVM